MSAIVPLPIRRHPPHRVGGWLPKNPKVMIDWLKELVKEERRKRRSPALSEPVLQFKQLIESTAELRMLASAMFDEVPDKAPYNEDPVGNKQVRSYHEMLNLFDYIMREKAPIWRKLEYEVGLIGFPFNAILDWPMATASGYAFFLKAEVNEKLKAILDTWSREVLMTEKSLNVITTGEEGWLSQESLEYIEADTNVAGMPLTFVELFECDPEKDPVHWGFKSWDDFFVRKFRNFDQIRPVAFANKPEWVVNSCESKAFALQTDVQEFDTFWLKGQPYSVVEMMDHHELASQFIGGSVYQAFLSATSYHRWNSPVSGDVIYSAIIPGTYFSEPTITGFTAPEGPDPAAPDRAQGYISHVATRAIFFIQAPDPIGLVCVIYIGMSDVSSCEILEKFNMNNLPAPVDKGEEIGMFHHGGSTYCLALRKEVKVTWVAGAIPGNRSKNLPIRSELALAYGSE